MGASITMAKGAADGGLFPAIAVIGDSTFTHSTGGQDSAGTGKIEAICKGIGVAPEHIRVLIPLKKNMEEMERTIREEIEYKGVSVLIPRRECIQTLSRKKRQK